MTEDRADWNPRRDKPESRRRRRRWPRRLRRTAVLALLGGGVWFFTPLGDDAAEIADQAIETIEDTREELTDESVESGSENDGATLQSYVGSADEFREVCKVDVPEKVTVIGPSTSTPDWSSEEEFWWVLSGTNSTGYTSGVVVVEPGAAQLDRAGVVFAKSGSIVTSIGGGGRALFFEAGAILADQSSLGGLLIECGEIVTSIETPEGGVDASLRPVDIAFAPDSESWPTIELDNEDSLSSFVFGADEVCLDRFRSLFQGLHDASPVEALVMVADSEGSVLDSRSIFVNDVGSERSSSHSISYSSGDNSGYGQVTDVIRGLCVPIAEAGVYSMIIELDPENLIEETNESNNRFIRVFEVSGF